MFCRGGTDTFYNNERALCRRQRNRVRFAREMRVIKAALSRKGSSVFSLSLSSLPFVEERDGERVRNCLCFSLLNGSFFSSVTRLKKEHTYSVVRLVNPSTKAHQKNRFTTQRAVVVAVFLALLSVGTPGCSLVSRRRLLLLLFFFFVRRAHIRDQREGHRIAYRM